MIRPIEARDRALYMELTGEFYTSSAVDHEIPREYRERTFEELLRGSPLTEAVILEYDGTAVGYALFAITFSQEAGGVAVWLEELYVREAWRSKGLGGELFEWCEKHFSGASRFRLEVEEDNLRAIALYKRRGYSHLPYMQMVKDV